MAIRTLLAGASGGSASGGAIELACRWAGRLRAHVEGFHVVNDPREVFAVAGGEFGIASAGLFAQLTAEAAAVAANARQKFAAIAARHGLAQRASPGAGLPPKQDEPSGWWREETGYAPTLVAQRARFFDLVVLGRSERAVGAPYTLTIEETLEQSGRPVLLAPPECPSQAGDAIALAWNGSPEAVRALVASLPLLTAAKTVSVITIGDAENQAGLGLLRDHLDWHGISAVQHAMPKMRGQSIGEMLLDAAAAVNADLLVMGGYGRRPWREELFGGATRDLLRLKTLPLLLVH